MGTPETAGRGHETRDVDVRGVALFGGALAAVVAIVLGLMVLLFDHFARVEARRQPEPTTLTARPAGELPPEPRLQQSPVEDLARMRADEDALLHSYGWADRRAGLVRMPIERAMRIVVEKGLE